MLTYWTEITEIETPGHRDFDEVQLATAPALCAIRNQTDQKVPTLGQELAIIVAAWLRKTRLIDNLEV